MFNLTTAVGRVRAISFFEGISFLLLMGIAMPLKYFANMPMAVKWTGWAHGLLFILLCAALLSALAGGALSFKKSALTFIAALLPFGPFIMDKHLKEEEMNERI